MIYHSTQFDKFLWLLILRGKKIKKEKKTKAHQNTKLSFSLVGTTRIAGWFASRE